MEVNFSLQRVCPVCLQVKGKMGFIKHPTIPGTYLTKCKLCTRARAKDYIKKLDNVQAATWCMLMEEGIPFIHDIWKETDNVMRAALTKEEVSSSPIEIYAKILETKEKYLYCHVWDSDLMLDDFWENEKKEKDANKKKDKGVIDYEQEMHKWGKYEKDSQIDYEAYDFLNATFNDYTKDIENMDANTVNRFRDLARCELRLRRANESGDGGEISKAQDSLNKQLALLGLNDFKKKDTDERKQFIDRLAWMIEETEPAEEEDREKYKDIAGYEKIYDSWMRSMRNLIAGSKDYPDIPKEEE